MKFFVYIQNKNQVSQELKQLYSSTQKNNQLFLRKNHLFIPVKLKT